jgi:LmbE family N-acetylglucosaminyl deacetylase
LGRRVAVLSPHLDDAVLSLGTSLARLSAAGVDVHVVTVFANDPSSTVPAGVWDAECGFRTAGEAATSRRDEDARACKLIGARATWLPFPDFEYERALDDEALWRALDEAVDGADSVLLPGFPLAAPDHLLLTRLLLRRPLRPRAALYVEQPYAAWRLIGRGGRTGAADLSFRRGIENLVAIGLRTREGRLRQAPAVRPELAAQKRQLRWRSLGWGWDAWRLKRRAIRAYESQVGGFGPLVVPRVGIYEFGWDGESIAWLPPV